MSLELKVNVTVDDETVERAVAILTWYCNDNNMIPVVSKQPDGEVIIQLTYDNGTSTCPTCGNKIDGQQVIPGFVFTEDMSDAK